MMNPEDDLLAHLLYASKVVELLKSITPQHSMGAVGDGSLSDVNWQLTSEETFSSFSPRSGKSSCPLPMDSG